MKLLKVLAISYVVKTALFGAAWLLIPDLPERTWAMARQTWAWVASPAVAEASAPGSHLSPPIQ
jgi:hypothetical protein